MSVLRAHGICKTFGERAVLKSAALDAHAGGITLLLGRNGSGKTTLMRIAAGLTRADQGTVEFRGVAYLRHSLARLARAGLFFLPERGLLPRNQRVGELLSVTAHRFGATDALTNIVDAFRLAELLEHRADELSGGEGRRTELALAALRAPACLLADEPFMGIAPKDAEEIGGMLRRVADAGCAVIVSGHEVPVLMRLGDEVVWVEGGTTQRLGTPAEAAGNWRFCREYLGTAPR